METLNSVFTAQPRKTGSKAALQAVRKEGRVPAVAYGPKLDPVSISIDPKDFLLKCERHGLSHVFEIALEGKESIKVMVKDANRNPLTNQFVHVDFYAVDMEKTLHVDVPVTLKGKPEGVVHGGLLSQVVRSVEVECLPKDMPDHLEADVSGLNLGESLHTSEIPLPKGVKLTGDGTRTVAIVRTPDGKADEPATEEAAAEAPAEDAK